MIVYEKNCTKTSGNFYKKSTKLISFLSKMNNSCKVRPYYGKCAGKYRKRELSNTAPF